MSNGPIYLWELIYQAKTQPVPAKEDIARLEWTVIWTEPVRVKPDLHPSRQQFLALPVPASQDIAKYEWTLLWQDPVRAKRGLPPHQQSFIAFAPTSVVAPSGTGNMLWHSPWSSVMVQNIMIGEG